MPKDQCRTDQADEGKKREFAQIMPSRFQRFKENLKIIIENLGTSTGRILENLEKADKELNEKMKKATETASNY